jgi:hypothetical protein
MTLRKGESLGVVLVVMKAGDRLDEHSAPGLISLSVRVESCQQVERLSGKQGLCVRPVLLDLALPRSVEWRRGAQPLVLLRLDLDEGLDPTLLLYASWPLARVRSPNLPYSNSQKH